MGNRSGLETLSPEPLHEIITYVLQLKDRIWILRTSEPLHEQIHEQILPILYKS